MIEASFGGQVLARSDRTVVVDGVRSPDAAWTYHHPSPFARRIKDHRSFWDGGQVSDIDRPVGGE